MSSRGRTPILLVPLLVALLVAGPGRAAAQTDAGGQRELALPRLSDSVQVSLISILPGDELYSVFGHSTFRVRDPAVGLDRSYNFGTFDFGGSPLALASFVARFTYGDLNYRLDVSDGERMIQWYWAAQGRASIEQTLALTRTEAQELFRRLEINHLPENRYYQYDFFFDNCATRLLDVLEVVLGEKLTFDAEPPGRSFRQLLDPFLTGARWLDLGMDLGLGLPADREASAREAAFLPEHLMEYFAAGRVDRDGESRPLVTRTERLTGYSDAAWQPAPEPRWPLFAGWALFAVGAFVTWRDVRSGRRSRPVADAALFGLLGVAGLAVAFLWFVSLHRVTDANFNLAWALPTHLFLALALARRRAERGWGAYLAATAALAAVLLAGMPIWPQELPDALVPLLLLVVVRAGWLGWTRLRRWRPA